MIVMRAESDVGVLELRIAAFDDADDVPRVPGVDDTIAGIEIERQLDAS